MATKKPIYPVEVTLASPFAFYDDDNALHTWAAGFVESDVQNIALLIERCAPIINKE